ncbi:helix-turn-helix transcriptional regulator [Staphylococcus simulans]|uniref:helix-turn-helix domain-containing protein n=1 Tax=Staphylococcus simulans TaxID=1286 RepID=UPI003132D38B
MNEFGKKIRELRGKKSLREASKGIGISHTYLDSLEKGYDFRTGKERKPTVNVINKISLYYNYSFEELIELADIFVSLKEIPDEQKEFYSKKFIEVIKEANNKSEATVKRNYANLLDSDLTVGKVRLLKNVYDFIQNEENNTLITGSRFSNVTYMGTLLLMLNENKGTENKELYEDMINSFDGFLKQYLNIK